MQSIWTPPNIPIMWLQTSYLWLCCRFWRGRLTRTTPHFLLSGYRWHNQICKYRHGLKHADLLCAAGSSYPSVILAFHIFMGKFVRKKIARQDFFPSSGCSISLISLHSPINVLNSSFDPFSQRSLYFWSCMKKKKIGSFLPLLLLFQTLIDLAFCRAFPPGLFVWNPLLL